MKDSKTIRNEHQSFVDAWKKIQEDNSSAPVEEGYKDVKKMLKTNKGYKKESKVLVRKSNAFTALAEKYNMSPKQFGRYVEANQHLFDIPTRKKAILANKFQGFKETKEWDEFFGDLELVESKAPYVVHTADKKGNTPAWQGYVEGKINEITGEPLYVAGEDANNQILGKLYVKNGLYLGESNASNTPATLLSRDSLLKLEGTDADTNNVGNKAVMTTSDGQVKIDTLHINQHFEIANALDFKLYGTVVQASGADLSLLKDLGDDQVHDGTYSDFSENWKQRTPRVVTMNSLFQTQVFGLEIFQSSFS